MPRKHNYIGGIIGADPFVPTDEHWDDVTLLLAGSDPSSPTINLKSGGATVSNVNSDVTTTTTDPGSHPYATDFLSFDYDDQKKLTIAQADSGVAFGNDDFTIEMWVNLASNWATTTPGSHASLIDTRSDPNNNGWLFFIKDDNKIYLNNGGDKISGTTAMSEGTWYHVALTVENNIAKLFLDGTQEGGSWNSTTNSFSPLNDFEIGYKSPTGSGIGNFYGHMADIRITKGVARYTGPFDPPEASFPTTADPIRPGVSNLGSLGGDGATTTRPTRRWGGITGRSLAVPTAAPAFKAVAFTGAGGTPSITGVGFQPDFVWIKNRDQADTHVITDVVRGVGKTLTSETADAEATDTDTVTSFDADGFSLGADVKVNTNTEDYVAWCWKAGGAVSADNNTVGSITSTASANTAAGFSVVKYTGTGSSETVGHGLNSAPELRIVKGLDSGTTEAQNWFVWAEPTGSNNEGILNGTATLDTYSASVMNGNAAPNADTFPLGSDARNNQSSKRYVAYCWHSVPGYSKIGSYTGNNSSTGLHVSCGFQPAFVMVRAVNSLGDWIIFDNARSTSNSRNKLLYANLNSQEQDGVTNRSPDVEVDFDSDGFTPLWTNNDLNNSESYIFMAFADTPVNTTSATTPTTGVLSLAEHYQSKL